MPDWARVLASHLLSVGLMLALMLRAGESPRIFIYGLFFNYLYRLLTLRGLIALHEAGGVLGRRLARALSRPPHPSRESLPVQVEAGGESGPGGLGAYLIVIAVCAGFTLMLVNVKDEEFVTPAATLLRELGLGAAAGLLWWLLDLVDRRLSIRFEAPLWMNLGFNSLETTLMAVTVLTGGVASGMMGTPWPYFIALVAFKTWFDVWEETKYPRADHL